MPMLQEKSQVEIAPGVSTPPVPSTPPGSEHKQRRQMLAALALLLLALILVLVKDRQFWFDSSPSAEVETSDDSDAVTGSSAPAAASPTHPIAPPAKPKERAKPAPEPVAPPMAPVVTNRAALPPLEVEVVAGDQHRTVQPGSVAVKVDMQPGVPVTPPPVQAQVRAEGAPPPAASSASERVRLSANTAQAVTRTVEPSYPMLAKQMKVQGSVVLEALIGREGNIQDLQVVNGPTILSSAAMEAVRQWRFKPYYQAGQAVETQARITVNFTISTY
jgi:periplasmic protein TonB